VPPQNVPDVPNANFTTGLINESKFLCFANFHPILEPEMPRISPEALSAAMHRLPSSPPEPPADLTPEGKKLWRQTVRDKQADWFGPVSTRLLRILVFGSNAT
jgi:hypothetical protein